MLKILALCVLAVSLFGLAATAEETAGKEAAAAPSKDDQIALLRQENDQLKKKVALLEQQRQALLAFYGANDQLRALESPQRITVPSAEPAK